MIWFKLLLFPLGMIQIHEFPFFSPIDGNLVPSFKTFAHPTPAPPRTQAMANLYAIQPPTSYITHHNLTHVLIQMFQWPIKTIPFLGQGILSQAQSQWRNILMIDVLGLGFNCGFDVGW